MAVFLKNPGKFFVAAHANATALIKRHRDVNVSTFAFLHLHSDTTTQQRDNATMVDAKAHLHLHLQHSNVTTPQWWMLRPTDICNYPRLNLKTVTTPQWWMLRPTYICTYNKATWQRHNGGCYGPPTTKQRDNATMADAKAHRHLQLPTSKP